MYERGDCGCSETTVEYKKCNECTPKPCDCAVKDLSTDCIAYTGEGLNCVGINRNTQLTDTLEEIDRVLCEVKNSVNNTVNLTNIGVGAKIYKGVSSIGTRELRTIESTEDIEVIEDEKTIKLKLNNNVTQNNFVRHIVIPSTSLPPNYNVQHICDYINILPESNRTIAETDSKWNVIVMSTQTEQP